MRLKYVIFRQHSPGHPDRGELFVPLTFPEQVSHNQVKVEGDAMLGIAFEPVRAGFVSIKWDDPGEVRCHGSSVSLKLSSDPEIDARLIKDHVVMGFPLQHQLIYASYDAECREQRSALLGGATDAATSATTAARSGADANPSDGSETGSPSRADGDGPSLR